MQMMCEACGDDDVILKCSGLKTMLPIPSLPRALSIPSEPTPFERIQGVAENISNLPEEERGKVVDMLKNAMGLSAEKGVFIVKRWGGAIAGLAKSGSLG